MKDPIDIVSNKISVVIKNANPVETKSIEVMSYALSLLINTVVTIFLIVFIGAVTETLHKTLLVMIVFAALRMLTKGGHFKSLTICVIVTTALIASIPHVNYSNALIIPFSVISAILILWRSTVNIPRRMLSVALVVTISTLSDQALTLICLVYALSLFPGRR